MNGIDNLNPDSSRYGYRASATYIDQFAGDTLGIALGVSAAQTPSQDERYNTWGYSGSGTADDPYVLGGAKPYVQSRSEEHTSELQSLMRISYAVFCLKKKNTIKNNNKQHR